MENITTKLAIELKKGSRSFYHPFLCTLPDDVTFIPAMWSESKIKEMDISGTQAERDLRDMQSKWREDATTFLSKLNEIEECSDAKKVSVSDWIWARATLQARGFSFYSRGRENQDQDLSDDKEGCNIVSFIPFITLSNHDDLLGGVTTMGKDPHPSTSYTFRTSSIKTDAGCQLFNYYGAISFQQKMLSFGWIDRCPEASPEGFCITALRTGSNTLLNDTGHIINPQQTIEIKSDILLATVVANMKKKEKSNEVNKSLLSNNLSLKVTTLKFEIRGVISKIVEQGMSREDAIADINRALLERKAMLEGASSYEHDEAGDEDEQTPAAAVAATVADTAMKPTTSSSSSVPIRGPTVKAIAPAMSRQKSKIRKGKGKGQSGLAVSEGETKVEVESDGQYIRRTEAEAVELLLSYVSTC